MNSYTKIVKEMLVPEDKYVSVIDTFDALGKVLETYDKVKSSKIVTPEEVSSIFMTGAYTLSLYPYWQAQAMGLRPLFLQAFSQNEKSSVEAFFEEAIPTALTFAMPTEYFRYEELRNIVRHKFKE